MNFKMEPTYDNAPGQVSQPAPETENILPAEAATRGKNQRLFDRGLIWLGVGIFLMAVSFGVNFFMFQADKSFITAMYTLTSVGAVCIMKGLADILGW